MSKVGGRRNFGFGKTLQFAVRSALYERFGSGRYGTQAAHRERLGPFVDFMRQRSIGDFRQIAQDHVEAYARLLRQAVDSGELATATAVNRLSSVNVLMSTLRRDDDLRISPRQAVGARCQVRTVPPFGMGIEQVEALAQEVWAAGHESLASLVRLCRHFGLRFCEASLLRLNRALAQAQRSGTIDVRDGTKGGRGRRVKRRVPVGEHGMAVLVEALRCATPESSRLLPAHQTYAEWFKYAHRVFRRFALRAGLSPKFHDLRAAYACARYQEVSGSVAPVIAGSREASRIDDAKAREVVARELGHGRASVTSAYCGGVR
jgi:site-specific recombinase XerC